MNQENTKQHLLLHVCCAPCSSHVLSVLHEDYDITAYFYNPNITERAEYDKRIAELRRFTQEAEFARGVTIREGVYEPERFFEIARGLEQEPERGRRCYKCYALRMEDTARYAVEHGYDIFTTTLSISPHKNAAWLNEIGAQMSDRYGVAYLYSDFKKKNGYAHSIELSRQYHLYRQDYCGCVFSREERRRQKALKEAAEEVSKESKESEKGVV